MGPLDGRIYRVLEVFTNLVYLNALWLLACLPLVTIAPATAAMFGVVRRWQRGDEPPVARTFFALLKEDFGRNALLGLVWGAVGAVLVVDFVLVARIGALRLPLFVGLLALSVLYAAASVYLFPLMADSSASWRSLLKNALLFPLSQPLSAVQGLAVVAVAVFWVVSLPIAAMVAGSATAWAVYFFCDRAFRRVELLKRGGSDRRAGSGRGGFRRGP
jgi:uncharacterized membrane protein YesL